MSKTRGRTCGLRGRGGLRVSLSLTSLATNSWGFKDELAAYLMDHGSEGKGGVTATLTLESVFIGRTWHYHLVAPAGDQRYMRCIWPGCDGVMTTCVHTYQCYVPQYCKQKHTRWPDVGCVGMYPRIISDLYFLLMPVLRNVAVV